MAKNEEKPTTDGKQNDVYDAVLEASSGTNEKSACFVSRFAKFQCSIVPINRKYSESGLEVSEPEDMGREIRFEEGVAYVEDDKDIAALLKRSDFGDAFCIDPIDRTGFWAKFKKSHPEVYEKIHEKSLAWKNNAETHTAMARAHAAAMGVSRTTEVKVMEIVGGRPPVLSGGREALTEEQEAALAQIGA